MQLVDDKPVLQWAEGAKLVADGTIVKSKIIDAFAGHCSADVSPAAKLKWCI